MEKLDIEIEVLKCKIREENLQEDFKEKLEEKLNNACENKDYITMEDIKKKKLLTRPYFCQKAAAVFACFIMLSSCAFAGGVGDWIKEMFSNVDQNLEVAYENGDVKEIETEYQTYDGVSVKVDYVSLKDNELYMVFNVKTEEECNLIEIKNIYVEGAQKNEIFNINNQDEYEYNTNKKSLTNINKLIFFNVCKKEGSIEEKNILKINIKNIMVEEKNGKEKEVYGSWTFEIKL